MALFRASGEEMEDRGGRRSLNVQLTPYERHLDGSVVGICVEDLIRVAVEAIVGAGLPKLRAVEIRVRDTEKGESGDGEAELENEQNEDAFGRPPAACNNELGHADVVWSRCWSPMRLREDFFVWVSEDDVQRFGSKL